MSTRWIELAAPAYLSVEPQQTGVETPADLLQRASSKGDTLCAWLRDGHAGFILRGKSVAWRADQCPLANLVVVIGKGRSHYDCVEVYIGRMVQPVLVAGRKTRSELQTTRTQDSETLRTLWKIFEALKPLFPEGASEGLLVDA